MDTRRGSHGPQKRSYILGAPQGNESCHWGMSGLRVQLLAEVGENKEEGLSRVKREVPALVKAGRAQSISMSQSKTFMGTRPLAF